MDSQDDLRDSDDERQNFAKEYLEGLRFLYKDAVGDNNKVCASQLPLSYVGFNNTMSQKWKGLFRSPFVLQTFAAHLTAIEGSTRVPDLHDTDKPTPAVIGGLGLSAASVRASVRILYVLLF